MAAVVPQGGQAAANLGAGQSVVARVEGAVEHLAERPLGDAVPAQPHAGDEDLLVQAQAAAPHQHQAGHGCGAGVLQARQNHGGDPVDPGVRAEEVRPQDAGGLAHERVAQVDVDDAGNAPGLLIEGDRPQFAGAQPRVQSGHRVLPGAGQIRDGEDLRVGEFGADLVQERLVGHAQRLVDHAPARPRGQVHGGLAVLVAAGQGRQLLVEPPAAGQG